MADILEQLSDYARRRVEEKKKSCPPELLIREVEGLDADRSFPLEKALREKELSFLCECKRASPSRGLIAEDFPYREIAKEYEAGGAAAISCLTEPKWFLGRDEYLKEIAEEVRIPVLRKDFTVDPYQIYEAKKLGASAVLLICSILSREEIRDDIRLADSLGLSALVETHDEWEVDTAVEAGARIVGVNNRNLRDFTVDLSTAVRLREQVPKDILFVAESGIKTEEDIRYLAKEKINGVLMGESLMRSENRRQSLEKLRRAAREAVSTK